MNSSDPAQRSAQEAAADADQDEPVAPDSPYLAQFGINAGWVEDLEDQYRIDAHSVDESWSAEFGGVVEPRAVRDELRRRREASAAASPAPQAPTGGVPFPSEAPSEPVRSPGAACADRSGPRDRSRARNRRRAAERRLRRLGDGRRSHALGSRCRGAAASGGQACPRAAPDPLLSCARPSHRAERSARRPVDLFPRARPGPLRLRQREPRRALHRRRPAGRARCRRCARS